MVEIPPDQIWMVVVGFVVAFLLAFGIGANDVANSFGTSVGAKVLSLRQACIFASVFETLGAVLLGAKVSDTIRKGIIDTEPYVNNTEQLMMGNVAALSGSCLWLFVATLLRLPVSATHSIVGATVGFALVAHGARGINWIKMSMIIGSWFVSPVLAGLISTLFFFGCKKLILTKEKPLEPGLRLLPVFYSFTIIVNFFSAFYDGPELFGFDHIPLWGTFVISFGAGFITLILVRFLVVPWQRRSINERINMHNTEEPDPVLSAESCLTDTECQKRSALKNPMLAEEEGRGLVLKDDGLSVKNGKISNATSGTGIMLTDEKCADEKLDLLTENKKNNTNSTQKNKPIINKTDDSPLMDNEYDLGSVTPHGQATPSGEQTPRTSEPANEDNNGAVVMTNGVAKSAEFSISYPSDKAKITYKVNGACADNDADSDSGRIAVKDDPASAMLFSFLQILTAIFGAFAHGGNDVSNAIGPLVSLWLIGTTQTITAKTMTPIWILFYGGIGISIGLWLWGRRVIKTLGEDLTKITPSSGFCIEIGSAFTVLVASNIGIPISTTHCKVGSVVFVGRFRSRENVDWSIFRNIVLAWVVTLPVSGAVSAAIMAGLQTML